MTTPPQERCWLCRLWTVGCRRVQIVSHAKRYSAQHYICQECARRLRCEHCHREFATDDTMEETHDDNDGWAHSTCCALCDGCGLCFSLSHLSGLYDGSAAACVDCFRECALCRGSLLNADPASYRILPTQRNFPAPVFVHNEGYCSISATPAHDGSQRSGQ